MGLHMQPITTGALWLITLVGILAAPATINMNHLTGCNVNEDPDSQNLQYYCDITTANKAIVLNEIKQPFIKDLTLYAHRELMYISLDDSAFSPNLEYLFIIFYCPFHISPYTFDGLEKLQWLRIEYGNFVSDNNHQVITNQTFMDESSLSFSPGWTSPIIGLTNLDLFIFNKTSFSRMQFCQLPQLQWLSLSDMEISTTEELGIICYKSQEDCIPCLPNVTYLNIMSNPIRSLGVSFSMNLPGLEQLDMRLCLLSSFDLGAFCTYSKGIQDIDIHGNRLTAIHVNNTDHCDCPKLEIWSMQRNRLHQLAHGLFLCTSHLRKLYLASNNLDKETLMNAGLSSLEKLVKLDLSYNKITNLDSTLIGNMTALTTFACTGCNLRLIENDSFSQLNSIKILQLDKNQIHVLDSSVFQSLVNLTRLDLSENYLKSTEFLFSLHNLKELYLGVNMLTEIPVLSGSGHVLSTLSLRENNITEIKPHQLSVLKKLKKLTLAFNNIQIIPDHIFNGSNNLEDLRLNSNDIKYFGANVLPRLRHLSLADNHIDRVLHFEAFYLRNIHILNLSRNSIESLYFTYVSPLEWIDVSWNRIREINFNIASIFSKTLKVVNLAHNRLTVVKEDIFTTPYLPRPKVYLQGNPLGCDCHSEWLLYTKTDRAISSAGSYFPQVPDLEQLQCTSILSGGNVSLSTATADDFVCQYEVYCCCKPGFCIGEQCHCQSSCFPECTCYYNHHGNINLMDCTSRSLTRLPDSGPTYAKTITLDNNTLSVLQSASLKFPRLECLFAHKSGISEVESHAFSYLAMLKVLDLQRNELETIEINTFSNLSYLEELYLNDNRIHFIENGSFDDLLKLTTLWLHGNELKSLDFTIIDVIHTLSRLTLHGNQWLCGCQFGPEFKKWVIYSKIVINSTMIHCNDIILSSQTNTTHNIVSDPGKIDENKTAVIETSPPYQALLNYDFTNCSERQFIDRFHYTKSVTEVVSLAAVFAVSVIITVTIFKTRLLIRVWFYNKFGLRFHKEEEDNDDKPYDLFIAYAKADERIVVREWLPELENADMSYKVCLECCDWPPAAATTEMVISSVQKSKRTIVLVSPNHLDTQWCEYAFDAAHYQVLTDKQIRLILVLTDMEIEARMTRAMKLYMKTNTYLVIGERSH